MSAESNTIGSNLQQLRLAAGIESWDSELAQRLAQRSGVAIERWRALEANVDDMAAHELSAIAEALGSDFASVLRPGGEAKPSDGYARFRSNEHVGALLPADRLLFAHAAKLSLWGGDLARLLGQDLPRIDAAFTAPAAPPWRDGYRRGRDARRVLQARGYLAPGPVDDLVERLATLGVHVADAPIEDSNIRGAVVHSPGGLPIILVRTIDRRHRSLRSVVAHELCHILHDGTGAAARDFVSRRSERHEAIEQRANGFAPSFLAPHEQVNALADDPVELARILTESWGFSRDGAAWHVRHLRRLPEDGATHIKQALPRLNPLPTSLRLRFRCKHPEAEEVAGGLAKGLIADLAYMACKLGAITERRFIEIAATQ